jgi:hypothetical protein
MQNYYKYLKIQKIKANSIMLKTESADQSLGSNFKSHNYLNNDNNICYQDSKISTDGELLIKSNSCSLEDKINGKKQ